MQFPSELRACIEPVSVDVTAWTTRICLQNLRQMNHYSRRKWQIRMNKTFCCCLAITGNVRKQITIFWITQAKNSWAPLCRLLRIVALELNPSFETYCALIYCHISSRYIKFFAFIVNILTFFTLLHQVGTLSWAATGGTKCSIQNIWRKRRQEKTSFKNGVRSSQSSVK